jgi:hypothetical protein
MGNIARTHHYIPQCYLRGFADSFGKKGVLHVFDLVDETKFLTRPRNVACIRDFNKVNVKNIQQDALENSFSKFESKLAKVLHNIGNSKYFAGDEKIYIINLMALLAVRSPQNREKIRKFYEDIANIVLSITLSSKVQYELTMRKIKNNSGNVTNKEATYENILKFHENGDYNIKVANEMHFKIEQRSISDLIPLLMKYYWSFVKTTNDSGYFITTDRP